MKSFIKLSCLLDGTSARIPINFTSTAPPHFNKFLYRFYHSCLFIYSDADVVTLFLAKLDIHAHVVVGLSSFCPSVSNILYIVENTYIYHV